MTAQNLIVVIGATGGQGGSVVDTFLNEPNWRVRGITRNSSSRKAEALKRRGVEVVQANLDDPASLVPAFEGANAIFLVSDFWAIYNELAGRPNAHPGKSLNEQAKERETQQLNNAIDVAAELPSLSRLVISSLPHAAKLTAGKYTHIYHYESKADAEDYAKEKYPDLWSKTSVFKGGFFLSNFTDHPMSQPTKAEDGSVQFVSNLNPDAKFPFIAQDEDTGPIVKALINEAPGKSVMGWREWLTLREVVDTFNEVTGYKAKTVQLPMGQFAFDCPPDLQPELLENWAFANEYGLEGRNDPDIVHPKDLDSPPELGTVADWLKKQDWAKVIPKTKATREGFAQLLPGSYDFQGISVPSHVAEQPFSDEETLLGATNRARNAQKELPDANFWVGIEGGVEPRDGSIFNFAWIVVIGKDGKLGRARTAGYFLPEKTCELLRQGVELGHADDQIFGQTNSKNKKGSVGILTDGVVDRADFYTQAVILALIPFKNASLTF
ncbi:hypothetical protein B0J15DRAFT_577103 [Fusarium solani]|uniref:inosine/xanthosine triphosphatase n=1 Tax=Fusarium solani TaxID=169388 RepID=A0A9P9L0T7_FUSSL|nr:uncharacterized protein B0J15DRAFT_577103 [Fusarium solani]KAH7271895.1 hypothetical protein B0J15DRAFT_577103 [Fusarium solani]